MTDYLRAVLDMIGPPENRYADPAAWARLEAELGTELPADYKTVPSQMIWSVSRAVNCGDQIN
ncbi:hypothetical protein ACWEBX_16170 [Streptomyces sp. NPDC005070]|uniref:hypothetical protein n=1 Tax=Streptomyces sp. NPDC005236 TaxID=3157028 RepID=UPI0033AFA38E